MIQLVVSYFATIAFSGMFNVPKEQYAYCGICGSVGWSVYRMLLTAGHGIVIATFFATLVLTFICRVFAVIRKMPITVFLIAGIFPLVPGAGIYFTAYYFVIDDNIQAFTKGLETFKVAMAISLGIVFIFSLPQSLFHFLGQHE